ncbi:high-potential iron-sulfur protein [Caballeronia sp. Lep1P3]|uniref:high-potential iron-sulfur protein n=1 Tax=Caballeronia sp. Lep1P3 TaxID=2878150 RepID=UPI00025BCD14|nr:high-potential iron-sulfur protein [Caballeronia sp. Lep1P3]EKS72748.1 high potential iron-sulfur protein [Burkholderia sp. SJ98]
MKITRRTFISVAAGLASLATLGRHAHADSGVVEESDANAVALGYKRDASQVDKTKFPKFQAGQACASCQLFQGKAGDAMAPCTIFGGKQVSAKGWCSAYMKRT